MATAEEAGFARTPLGADLAQGVESISYDQEITFTRYVRLVLPLDGFVFWVLPGLLTPSALLNVGRYNAFGLNQPPEITQPQPTTLVVQGALHYGTETRQEQEEAYAANRVIFTALQRVNDFQEIAPGEMWIGRHGPLTFAFSTNTSRFEQAGLWHYVGYAVWPDMQTQIVDSIAGFNRELVVSNSLPAWLGLNSYAPFYGVAPPAGLVLFPSFLTPHNERPPFGAVHIPPEGTRALASAPRLGRRYSHSQLCADMVRVTLWGARNADAMDFVDSVYQYTLDGGRFGIMNMPVVRDEKRIQSELGTIAMKKTIEFEVSYLQHHMRDVARQLIERAIVGFIPSEAA
jgi:hypothetical protein